MIHGRLKDTDKDQELVLIDSSEYEKLKKDNDDLRAELVRKRVLMNMLSSDLKQAEKLIKEYESNYLCKFIISLKHFFHDMYVKTKDFRFRLEV